jgi:hypothetical protein
VHTRPEDECIPGRIKIQKEQKYRRQDVSHALIAIPRHRHAHTGDPCDREC